MDDMNVYDFLGDLVSDFWKQTVPDAVICFFYMGYTLGDMEYYMELATPEAWDNYDKVIFENDFCEGQTCCKLDAIVPLDRVCKYYRDNVLKPWEGKQ